MSLTADFTVDGSVAAVISSRTDGLWPFLPYVLKYKSRNRIHSFRTSCLSFPRHSLVDRECTLAPRASNGGDGDGARQGSGWYGSVDLGCRRHSEAGGFNLTKCDSCGTGEAGACDRDGVPTVPPVGLKLVTVGAALRRDFVQRSVGALAKRHPVVAAIGCACQVAWLGERAGLRDHIKDAVVVVTAASGQAVEVAILGSK